MEVKEHSTLKEMRGVRMAGVENLGVRERKGHWGGRSRVPAGRQGFPWEGRGMSWHGGILPVACGGGWRKWGLHEERAGTGPRSLAERGDCGAPSQWRGKLFFLSWESRVSKTQHWLYVESLQGRGKQCPHVPRSKVKVCDCGPLSRVHRMTQRGPGRSTKGQERKKTPICKSD